MVFCFLIESISSNGSNNGLGYNIPRSQSKDIIPDRSRTKSHFTKITGKVMLTKQGRIDRISEAAQQTQAALTGSKPF